MTTTSTFGPAWFGWQDYKAFSEAVRTTQRFVRSPASEQFLNEVRASCASRKVTVPTGSIFWRARVGCELERQEEEDYPPKEMPYGRDSMKPIPNWQAEGRANPRGIPALYMATTRDTALAEVRPWIGANISVAQLKTERDLNVIDCSKYHGPEHLLDTFDGKMSRVDGIWRAIDRAFATPVSKEEEAKDYIPTQILAELFKAEGYDGVVFKSLLSPDGYNVTLFNLEDAKVINGSLFTLHSIEFKFSDTGTQVFFG